MRWLEVATSKEAAERAPRSPPAGLPTCKLPESTAARPAAAAVRVRLTRPPRIGLRAPRRARHPTRDGWIHATPQPPAPVHTHTPRAASQRPARPRAPLASAAPASSRYGPADRFSTFILPSRSSVTDGQGEARPSRIGRTGGHDDAAAGRGQPHRTVASLGACLLPQPVSPSSSGGAGASARSIASMSC